jgi:hypothetical protein
VVGNWVVGATQPHNVVLGTAPAIAVLTQNPAITGGVSPATPLSAIQRTFALPEPNTSLGMDLNFSALAVGLVIAPRRVWRAFRRGRSSNSLYNETWNERWLDESVSSLRLRLGIDSAPSPNVFGDVLLFAACAIPGLSTATLGVAVIAALVSQLGTANAGPLK